MKFDRIPNVGDADFLPVPIRPRPRLQLVPLGEALVAAFFDTSDRDAVATSQLAAWSGDEALCLPLLGSRLIRRDGGVRYVFFLSRSSRELCRKGLWITRDDRPLAEVDPSALQSPVVDALALVVGLAPEGEQRLLRLLLTTGQSLFGDSAFAGIRDIVVQLLERLAPPALVLRAWCPVGRTAAVASYALPRDLAPGEGGMFVAIAADSARRLAGAEAEIEEQGDTRLLHLFLPSGAANDTTLVALSDAPLRLSGPTQTTRHRPLGPWLAKRSPQIRRRIGNQLNSLARKDKTAAALLEEISCPDTALPEVVPHLVNRTASGIHYILGVRDPRRLLSKLVLKSEVGEVALPLRAPAHHPRFGPIQVGFAQVAADVLPDEGAELHMLYKSGRLARVATVALTPMTNAIPPLLEELPAAQVAPSLAAALADVLRHRPRTVGEIVTVAAPLREARVTLVVELGESLDYLFALAASVAGQGDVTLMLHHPDRRALAALRSLGEELNAIYGLGVSLLDFADEDLLPAERTRAAIARAGRGPVICLSDDVLPRQRSWLDTWLSRLDRREAVLAGVAATGHDMGHALGAEATGAEPGVPVSGRAVPEEGQISARAFGVNAAAREVLGAMPLRVAGCAADIADLAATLGKDPEARVTLDTLNPMTAHARKPERSRALVLAERLTLEGATSA